MGKRVLDMTLLWLLFGVFVGIASSPLDADVLRIISGAIAGMIVTPSIGAMLGLVGARVPETVVGGLCGIGCGLLAGMATSGDILPLINVSFVSGAIVGGTFLAGFRQVKKRLHKALALRN